MVKKEATRGGFNAILCHFVFFCRQLPHLCFMCRWNNDCQIIVPIGDTQEQLSTSIGIFPLCGTLGNERHACGRHDIQAAISSLFLLLCKCLALRLSYRTRYTDGFTPFVSHTQPCRALSLVYGQCEPRLKDPSNPNQLEALLQMLLDEGLLCAAAATWQQAAVIQPWAAPAPQRSPLCVCSRLCGATVSTLIENPTLTFISQSPHHRTSTSARGCGRRQGGPAAAATTTAVEARAPAFQPYFDLSRIARRVTHVSG